MRRVGRRVGAGISAIVARGYAWWIGELISLLPKGLRSAGDMPRADLIVIAEDGEMTNTLPPVAGLVTTQSILDEIGRRSRRRPLRIRLRIPVTDCLVRPVTVPRAALPDIARIAALDLERTTPFRRADIYSAIVTGAIRRGRGSLTAEHIVVKRAKIAALQSLIEGVGAELSAADCYRADPAQPLPIDFLSESGQVPEGRRASSLLSTGRLATAAAGLAFAAVAIATYRHEAALLSLQEETAAMRSRVHAARSQLTDQNLASLPAFARLKSAYPPVVEILEDLARRLPDSAYITQLRLVDGSVDIGGFGRPVRSLAPELEQSPFVESATITAPIVTDEKLQKERFDLRLRLARQTSDQLLAPAVETAP